MMKRFRKCLVAVTRKMGTQPMFVPVVVVIGRKSLFPVRAVFVCLEPKFILINGPLV